MLSSFINCTCCSERLVILRYSEGSWSAGASLLRDPSDYLRMTTHRGRSHWVFSSPHAAPAAAGHLRDERVCRLPGARGAAAGRAAGRLNTDEHFHAVLEVGAGDFGVDAIGCAGPDADGFDERAVADPHGAGARSLGVRRATRGAAVVPVTVASTTPALRLATGAPRAAVAALAT